MQLLRAPSAWRVPRSEGGGPSPPGQGKKETQLLPVAVRASRVWNQQCHTSAVFGGQTPVFQLIFLM